MRIWNKENVAIEALKYNSRSIFQKLSAGAYLHAQRNKYLDEICSHMMLSTELRSKWNKENVAIEALKYFNKSDFVKNSKGAYDFARRNNLLNKICSHMVKDFANNIIWTKDICKIEALKYSSKKDFLKNNRNAHDAAWKNGWLDEICSHMEVQGSLFKRLIYAYEFSDNHVYIGLTYNIEKRQQNRNADKNDPVIKHINETNLIPERKILTEFLEKDISSKTEGQFLQKYKSEGWKILNRRKTGSLGGNNSIILTKDQCLKSAKKYQTRSVWYYSDIPAYNRAKKYGDDFFEECCKHMIQKRHKIYKFEELKAITDKYLILSEFKIKEPKIYCAILNRGYYQILTKHMIRKN